MAVVSLVLGTPSVLDVMAITFFALHDPMDGALGAVLAIVVEATSKFSLFALAVALVDVAAGIATTLVLVEVGALVDTWRGVRPGLVDLLLDFWELAMRRPIGSATQVPARHRCR
jgi:hypothetical protein